MYSLESLQQKNLKELKEIGWQMNVLPAGDKRCRQNWIDALADTQPPLLQLLEVSPGVEVQALDATENIPADRPIGLQDIVNLLSSRGADSFAIGESVEMSDSRLTRTTDDSFVLFRNEEVEEIQAQALPEAIENSPGVDSKFGRIAYPQPAKSEPKVSQSAIAQTTKNSPGVDHVQELIESKIEPAAFRELTFSEALKVCRSISEALPAKNLKELQALRLKVLDLTARPGSSRFHGHSKHKSSWIAEIRSELTYLLEIRAIAFPPPIGLGRTVSPGCLEKSWDIPTGTTEAAQSESRMSQSAIAQTAEKSPGIEPKFGRITYPQPVQSLIAPETKSAAETIQAITLHQPWASIIANGFKEYETRHWKTDYRGLIAIHAGKKQGSLNPRLLEFAGIGDASKLPAGAVVAIAELTDCILMTEEFIATQPKTERDCGDWTIGRYAWKLENVRAIEPVAISGKQGLWAIEIQALDAIAQATKNSPGVEVDQKPILTGIALSESFLARYSPPQSETIHYQADSDGQLSVFDPQIESANEPPDPDDYQSTTDFDEAYAQWLAENNETDATGISTESAGADEIAITPELPTGLDNSAKPDGTCSDNQDEGLGSQKGDRILEGSGPDSGSAGRVPSHQPPELKQAPNITPQAPNITPQAPNITAFNDEERPPNRGDGRKSVLAIGMQVGRKRDRQHIGTILNIYRSKRGIWRAKVQPLNKSNFVYFDCYNLIEQKLLYNYEMKPGDFIPSGKVFDKARGEMFEVCCRKARSPKPTNWTLEQLGKLSIFKLKQIARDMDISAIPGTAGKRSLIRAILAEQVISQEKASAQREAIAHKQKSAPTASKKKRVAASPLGNQLSLFDVAV
jgi:hypothetical protein